MLGKLLIFASLYLEVVGVPFCFDDRALEDKVCQTFSEIGVQVGERDKIL